MHSIGSGISENGESRQRTEHASYSHDSNLEGVSGDAEKHRGCGLRFRQPTLQTPISPSITTLIREQAQVAFRYLENDAMLGRVAATASASPSPTTASR